MVRHAAAFFSTKREDSTYDDGGLARGYLADLRKFCEAAPREIRALLHAAHPGDSEYMAGLIRAHAAGVAALSALRHAAPQECRQALIAFADALADVMVQSQRARRH